MANVLLFLAAILGVCFSLSVENPADCYDTLPECSFHRYYCAWFAALCPATCDVRCAETGCRNELWDCAEWKDECASKDKVKKEIMKSHCAVTCKTCGEQKPPKKAYTCADTAADCRKMQGKCDDSKVKERCPATCDTNCKVPCKDEVDDCVQRAPHCFQMNFQGAVARAQCPVVCGQCKVAEPKPDHCSTKETVLDKNENGTIKLVAAIENACVEMDNSDERDSCNFFSDFLKGMVEGGEDKAKITVATINCAFEVQNFVDVVKKASIPGWGTMLQFLDCTPVKIAGWFSTYPQVPPTWSYPPESMKSPSQSANSAAANLVVTQGMQTLTDTLSKLFPEMGITAESKEQEVLLFENLSDAPDFGGIVWIVENGLMKKSCYRYDSSECNHRDEYYPYGFFMHIAVQEAEYTFGRLVELNEAIKQALNNMGLPLSHHTGYFSQAEHYEII